jgi:hypothetical protein
MADDLKISYPASRCRNLLSKGLYVNAGLPPGEEASGDGHFWCAKTQRIFGPDERLCDGENCRDASRTCFEAP